MDMIPIKKTISIGNNVVLVGETGEGKITDVETVKAFVSSKNFSVEDAGELRLTDVER